jgi:S-DNA-T family DNA segregation ATPase FtsK/SpoIIIE
VALKWAVREMEDRYRMMKLGVRNIDGLQRKSASRPAPRASRWAARVQTGFDPETGQPIYRENSRST